MAHVSEAQLARGMAALREKHRFYQTCNTGFNPPVGIASSLPKTKRPGSAAAKRHNRTMAAAAAKTSATTPADPAPLLPNATDDHVTAEQQQRIEGPVPATRGRIRPRSAVARRRRFSSLSYHGSPSANVTGTGRGVAEGLSTNRSISEELLREYSNRKQQQEHMFARELVDDMRSIAADTLTKVKEANHYVTVLGVSTHFTLVDRRSLVPGLENDGIGMNESFDEAKALFSSKLLVKKEQLDGSTPRYLSLSGFMQEYIAIKRQVEKKLEVLPPAEAEAMVTTTAATARTITTVSGQQSEGRSVQPYCLQAHSTNTTESAVRASAGNMDDEELEMRLQKLLDDVTDRKQQIDEQLQLLQQLGWNALR